MSATSGGGGALTPYSWRTDPAVPAFPDDRPLIVFDGVCILCTGFARFVIRRDRRHVFRFTTAQSPLGQGLYRHFGLSPVAFETNLVLAEGRLHVKLGAFAAVIRGLGWPWRALGVIGLLPRRPGDWLYERIARNRYRLFGRTEDCMLPPPDWRDRFLTGAAPEVGQGGGETMR